MNSAEPIEHTAEPIERVVRERAEAVARVQGEYLRELMSIARLSAIRDYFLASDTRRQSRLQSVQAALAGRQLGAELCLIDDRGSEHLRAVNGHLAANSELAHNETEAPFFAEGMRLGADETHLSSPYASPDVQEWVLGYVVPVIPGKAILHFEHPLTEIQAQAAQGLSSDSRFLLVLDRSGIIFGDSRRPVNLSTTGDALDAAANFQSIAEGAGRLPAEVVNGIATAPERTMTIAWQGQSWDIAWRRIGPLVLIGLQHIP